MPLWKRILVEKRALIVPLVARRCSATSPPTRSSSIRSASSRPARPTAPRPPPQSLQAAERELAAARALVTGKTRADQELATFYDKVLPADLPSARRLTYATLPALARKTNVKLLDRRFEVEQPEKNARLGLLKIHTQWQGDYESFRQFIYELESAPEFVIIDDVTLAQNDPAKPLTLILELSTYYRLGANGN